MYRHVCRSCSKSIEVLMARAVCICSCKRIMAWGEQNPETVSQQERQPNKACAFTGDQSPTTV